MKHINIICNTFDLGIMHWINIRHTIRPSLKALSRRPGQSTKKSRFCIQSASMNSMWSLINVQKQNVKTLVCKSINTGFSGCDFYDKKSNKDFLKKILSTEKHYWANKQIYKRMNIVWFLGKMYYFTFSWCLNYRNRK